jgi:putative DNA primase/helicase
LRTFANDIVANVLRERGRLVAAALTVLRAWHVSGERVRVVPFGSFESWSYRVREPLLWLGRADPCETVAKVREDDPRRTALLIVVVQWKEALGTASAHTMREIIGVAANRPDFHNALLTVAAARSGSVVSNDRLGRWLKANEGKIVNGLSLARDGIANGYPLWRLTEDRGGQWT